jgi:stage III sporulation protein SpoIIIAA
MSGIQPGLTMVVGPPGTGKTDTVVQILNVLYHNCPSQRTLIITHSNHNAGDVEDASQVATDAVGSIRTVASCCPSQIMVLGFSRG